METKEERKKKREKERAWWRSSRGNVSDAAQELTEVKSRRYMDADGSS
jgi:hypothetical protein